MFYMQSLKKYVYFCIFTISLSLISAYVGYKYYQHRKCGSKIISLTKQAANLQIILNRKKKIIADLNVSVRRHNQEVRRLSKKVYNHFLPDLVIKNYAPIDYKAIFNRNNLLSSDIKTIADFTDKASSLYKHYLPLLSKKWHLPDSQRLRAIFYLNLVSHLWPPGAKYHINGCLLLNRSKKDRSIVGYLKAKAACCDDFAFFLKLLLDSANIKTEYVLIGPHIFVESYLDGGWYSLDADADLMFQGRWFDIVNRPQNSKVIVSIFPSPRDVFFPEENNLYAGWNQLQLRMIMRALSRFKATHFINKKTILKNLSGFVFHSRTYPE